MHTVVTGAVMTHPNRTDRARLLVAESAGLLELVTDPDPTGPPAALRTALRAWSSVPAGSTHHLVLHDDMVLSEGFFDRVRRAVEAAPDAALALFSFWNSRNGAAVRLGALAGARWVPAMNEYTPCTALVLPREIALGYAGYVRAEQESTGETWPEDVYMYRYLRSAGVPVLVAVPNLAEHEDLSSLSGNNFQGLRRSACFVETDPETDEDVKLDRPPAVPFFKYGQAQCAVPVANTGRWLNIPCEDYLSGLGVDIAALREQLPRGIDPVLAWPLWLTAYALGVVSEMSVPVGKPDAAVLDAALATLAPGGLCHSPAAPDLGPAATWLARAGLERGRGDAATPLRGFDSARADRALTHVAEFDTGEAMLYGPGMPRDTLVGRLLWQALVNRPLRTEEPDRVVSLLHTSELVAGRPVPGGTRVRVRELAEAIRRTVRPVPWDGEAGTPELDAAQTAALDFGLHTAAQWLAYEAP